jgi:hypothetical protein
MKKSIPLRWRQCCLTGTEFFYIHSLLDCRQPELAVTESDELSFSFEIVC